MLISESYKQQNADLHHAGGYGVMGEHYAPLISGIINKIGVTHLLDYGCGSRLSLARGLQGKVKGQLTYQAYDPCVKEYETPPVPAEMVACVDVLEHIEPDSIEEVLDHLQSLVEAVGVFTVDTGPAKKVLSDGRNAHLLQRPIEWWLAKFCERFQLQTFQVTHQDMDEPLYVKFYVIVYAMPTQIESTNGDKLHG
jgi:hypothetical protein